MLQPSSDSSVPRPCLLIHFFHSSYSARTIIAMKYLIVAAVCASVYNKYTIVLLFLHFFMTKSTFLHFVLWIIPSRLRHVHFLMWDTRVYFRIFHSFFMGHNDKTCSKSGELLRKKSF